MILTAHDLHTITVLEGGNPLVLWRFTEQSNNIRKTTEIQSFSALDEFGSYRKSNYSYYFGDEKPPNFIWIGTEFSGGLRREALKKRDWHVVKYHDNRSFVEVTTLHGTTEIPIYVPVSLFGDSD